MDNKSDIKRREVEVWNLHLDQEAWRKRATFRWYGELLGHAKALARLGVIDEEELREMLELADAALEHVKSELEVREWEEDQRKGDL